MAERIDSSQQVVVAKVINEESYWEADSAGIYTSYTMEVVCYTKNASGHYYFDLLLPGGTVGDEVQINFPYIHLEIGQEYLVATENVSFYQLNRKHRARSSNPKYQPYSYVQGVLPFHNGFYHDYFETVPYCEDSLLTMMYSETSETPTRPDGTIFEARDTFETGNGDYDNDGVMNIYDEDPNNPDSDSDGDGITDWQESQGNTNSDGTVTISNPLNACDPNPQFGGCIGVDLDGDGSMSNYPPSHAYFDSNDSDSCVPYASAGCPLIDNDLDGWIGNLLPNDPNRDSNDNNPCIPNDMIDIGVLQDSWINEMQPMMNYGDSTWLQISGTGGENKRALLQFESVPIPFPIEAIAGGEIHLFVDMPTPMAYQLEIFPLLQAWQEGTTTQGQGAVNWQMAEQGISWQPGGNVDYNMGGTIYVGNDGWAILPLDPFILQYWLSNAANDFGFLLKLADGVNGELAIASSESTTPPRIFIHLDTANCNIPQARTPIDQNPINSPLNRLAINLSNGAGTSTNTFVGGTIEDTNDIIISGSGFGTNPGLIEFPNADNGGASSVLVATTDLVYWRDNEIRLKIPKNAGSGTMNLKTASGALLASAEITINWVINPLYHDQKAFNSKTRQRIKFVDINGEGGYSIQLNTNSGFASDTEAVAAFERAFNTWVCATDVNWTLDKSGISTTATKDDFCVIEYSTGLPAGVLALTTSSYKGSSSSSCDQHNTLWRLRSFDIQFAAPSSLPALTSWNFSESDPSHSQFDFESIALHELGHAHGLGHIIDEESVMHFSIANGIKKRTLKAEEIDAGAHKLTHSLTSNCVSSYDPMTIYSGDACSGTPSVNLAKVKVFLEGAYKAETGDMKIDLSTENILPLAQPFNSSPYNYAGTETVTAIPPLVVDWLLLELRASADMEQVIHQQAVFLRNDGMLIALDGTETISFPNLTTDSYYVAIYHQSHLPIISSTPHSIQPTALLYDFTSAETMAMGEGQLKEQDGLFLMNCGDFDSNGLINNEDYNLWKINSSSIDVYSPADADGNGVINNLDYNLWKVNLSKIGTLRK